MNQTLTHFCRAIRLSTVLVPLSLIMVTAGTVLARENSPRQASGSSSHSQQQQKQERDESKTLAGKLAEETREAAGEEDEKAAFTQSPSIKWLARITGLSQQHAYWLAVLLNFGAVLAALLWAARKFLPGLLRERTAAIQKAMEEARQTSAEARRRLSDIEARLSRLDIEIASMRAGAEKEAQAEEARLKEATEADTRKIIASAQQEIAAATKQARRELAAYAADLAVSHAQKQLRVDAETDQTLVRGFAEQLSAKPSNGAGTKKGRN